MYTFPQCFELSLPSSQIDDNFLKRTHLALRWAQSRRDRSPRTGGKEACLAVQRVLDVNVHWLDKWSSIERDETLTRRYGTQVAPLECILKYFQLREHLIATIHANRIQILSNIKRIVGLCT